MESLNQNMQKLIALAGTGDTECIIGACEAVYEEAVAIYRNGDIPAARDMTLAALELIEGTQGTEYSMAEFHTALSDFSYLSGLHREALKSSFTAADLYRKAGRIDEEGRARANCGGLLINFGDYTEAYQQLLLAQRISQEKNMPVQEGQCSLNIAFILQNRGELEQAMEELEKAKKLFADAGFATGRGFCLNRLADIKMESKDYPRALALHEEALDIMCRNGLVWEKLMLAANYGSSLVKAEKPQEALALCHRILEDTPPEESPDYRGQVYTIEAEALLALEQPESALESMQKAEALFQKSQGGDEARNDMLKLRAKAMQQMGSPEKAYTLLAEYLERADELKRREKKQELSEMRIVTEVKTALQRDVISKKNLELEDANKSLRNALEQVRTLSGMLPICPSCKRIRDDAGYWQQIESYISTHSSAQFSHSMCSDCLAKHYPDIKGDPPE